MARVDGKPSGGTFWQSTAAMITAIATLIASLVGLAAFLVGQQIFGGGDGPADPRQWPGGQVPTSQVKVDQNTINWQGDLVVDEISYVDFDTVPPTRGDGEADLFHWGSGDISGSYRIYLWPEPAVPTATQCATFLATHGVTTHIQVEPGSRLCVRSGEGRTALVEVKERQGQAWLVNAVVWRQRT